SYFPPCRHSFPTRRSSDLGVLLAVVVAVVGYASYLLSAPSDTPGTVEFEVMPGWGGKRVAQELAEAGLVRSATVFEYYLRFRERSEEHTSELQSREKLVCR